MLVLVIVKLYVPGVVGVGRYEQYMEALRKSGNSCGAVLRVQASGVPAGLYDRLDADIAYAMMGLNAVKAVEIGAGLASATLRQRAQCGDVHPVLAPIAASAQ